jgi:hypothetical protein
MLRKAGRPKGRKNEATVTIQMPVELKGDLKKLYGRKLNNYILFLIQNDLATTGGLAHKTDIGGRLYFAPEYEKRFIDNLKIKELANE